MKFAPVCPIQVYEEIENRATRYALGDYFLLLAHDVLENAARYHDFFVTKVADHFGTRRPFIIMDNSVIELGTSCKADVLMRAAEIVHADVLVMPDALQNGKDTIEATRKFTKEWAELEKPSILRSLQFMFVPQGSSDWDYMSCVDEARADPAITEFTSWIGVARNLTDRVFPTRALPISYIHTRFGPDIQMHMLGFSDNTADDIQVCRAFRKHLKGIDSAVPLRMANAGMAIDSQDKRLQDPGPRGDWWETAKYTPLVESNLEAIRNILTEY